MLPLLPMLTMLPNATNTALAFSALSALSGLAARYTDVQTNSTLASWNTVGGSAPFKHGCLRAIANIKFVNECGAA